MGILMERYGIDERQAVELLRSHSRRTSRKLIDLAEAVSTSHLLLARQPPAVSNNSQPSGVRAEDGQRRDAPGAAPALAFANR